ncbi:DUF4269 domain-containing protein [Brevibacillus panacihumi]|uniref:DUF4269 domain-containing protein n=1 Tax=Brevibacillus panacihumi TaxID=497735 RepID=A0A3M8CC04_9BACL|nr:DUF4269 domain-containing protein [Brevibacillus panacihumi]RNB73250.1 DUF4269 domain-containing protein [Brevibacillus panacihumi]
MLTDWQTLKAGNPKQQLAYQAITELRIPEELASYTPVLCGTIPIEIDTDQSDLDVIMEVHDFTRFQQDVTSLYGGLQDFVITQKERNGIPTIKANFFYSGFAFELFGQPRPVKEQNAYLHMIVEHALMERDPGLKETILRLKEQGIKTEPAFACALQLPGDPYMALIDLGKQLGILPDR